MGAVIDTIKMTTKGVTLTALVAGAVALFVSINIPITSLQFTSNVVAIMNKVYTILAHYIPTFTAVWGLCLALFSFEMATLLWKAVSIAGKFILKINE